MKMVSASSVLLIILGSVSALAQAQSVPSASSMRMEMHGSAVTGKGNVQGLPSAGLDQLTSDIPTHQLSKLVQTPILERAGTARSAKDVQLYRAISPSIVYVANKEGFGSGSLVDASGDILTNWHVVNGYEYVAVIFKPAVEGKEPTRDETKLGRVVKYDEIADLTLVAVSDVPTGRVPIRLGDSSEMAVGADVHAIGHPDGQSWTYTTGVISQYRQGFGWEEKGDAIKHKADIIQTQTPINPGNSGGPLLADTGHLIGINTFKASGGEGLNFAVSVDDVKKFLVRPASRLAQEHQKPQQSKAECKPRELSTFRNKENNATVVSFDMYCTGKDSAEYVTPDA
jgi:S1-C subfamily serine protease